MCKRTFFTSSAPESATVADGEASSAKSLVAIAGTWFLAIPAAVCARTAWLFCSMARRRCVTCTAATSDSRWSRPKKSRKPRGHQPSAPDPSSSRGFTRPPLRPPDRLVSPQCQVDHSTVAQRRAGDVRAAAPRHAPIRSDRLRRTISRRLPVASKQQRTPSPRTVRPPSVQ